MLVDYELVLLDVKAQIASKHSHGQRELLALIARLEARHRLAEGLPEMAIRLYGAELTDALRQRHGPATALPAGARGDGSGAHSLSDGHDPKESSHGSRYAVA